MLLEQLLHRVLADWQNENDDQPEVFDANIARVERCFEQRVEAAAFVNDKINVPLVGN